MTPRIRPFPEADAPRLVGWLQELAPAEDVCTEASLVHLRRSLPRRGRPRWLVAVVDGEPVGIGQDGPQVFRGILRRRSSSEPGRPAVAPSTFDRLILQNPLLGSLAKLSALDRAGRAGVQRVGTANDEDNGPMLAINRRLGHRQLQDLITYTRRLPEPA